MTGRWVSVATIALVVSPGVAVPRIGSSQPSPSARRYTLHALGRCLDVAGGVSAKAASREPRRRPGRSWQRSRDGVLLIIGVPVTGVDPCQRGCRVGSPIPPQVGAMIQRMLGLTEPAQEDAADALAVAITHTNATGLAALLKRA